MVSNPINYNYNNNFVGSLFFLLTLNLIFSEWVLLDALAPLLKHSSFPQMLVLSRLTTSWCV
jgi:hypothetical protein